MLDFFFFLIISSYHEIRRDFQNKHHIPMQEYILEKFFLLLYFFSSARNIDGYLWRIYLFFKKFYFYFINVFDSYKKVNRAIRIDLYNER